MEWRFPLACLAGFLLLKWAGGVWQARTAAGSAGDMNASGCPSAPLPILFPANGLRTSAPQHPFPPPVGDPDESPGLLLWPGPVLLLRPSGVDQQVEVPFLPFSVCR